MATTSRLRIPTFGITIAAFAAVLIPSGIGQASPSGNLTLSEVRAQMAVLDARAEKISESFDAANDKLAALQHKAKLTEAELARDQVQLNKAEQKLAASAAAAYRSGGLDATMSLVTSGSPQTFLDQTSTLQEVSRYQASQLANADLAQRAMSAAQVLHDAEVAQQKDTLASISKQRSAIEALVSQEHALLARLSSAEQAQYSAAQNAVAAHELALRGSYEGPASGQAAAAVQFAYAQLGKPYYYGGAGPDSFDCSGLTMQAWAAAGVYLPHNAAAQQADIPAVSLGDLEPGDLLFFGSPAYHVGLYIGGGRMIAAPHTGTVVQIQSLTYESPTSAGRP